MWSAPRPYPVVERIFRGRAGPQRHARPMARGTGRAGQERHLHDVYFRLALVKACDRKRTREEHSRAAGRDLPRCRHGVGNAPREASSEHKDAEHGWCSVPAFSAERQSGAQTATLMWR